MKRLLWVGIFGLSLAFNAVVAVIWLAPEAILAHREDPRCPVLRLDLSEAERAAVEPIRERFQQVRREHHHQFTGLRARLAALAVSDPVDREAIGRLLDEMSAIQVRLQREAVERVLAIRQALGPENRAKYDEMIVPHIQAGNAMRCDCECPESEGR